MRQQWKTRALFASMLGQAGLCVAATPTFTRDVAPILQKRCQECHRPGEIGPFPMLTYEQTRPWAAAIREAVLQRTMPPWFADPRHGKFSNDRSLSRSEIDTLVRWVDGGAPRGDPAEMPPPASFVEGWGIPAPDVVFELPEPYRIPATGTIEYLHWVIPTGFTTDRWIHNHYFKKKFAYESPEDVLRAIEGLSTTVGCTLDTGHIVSCGYDTVDAVRKLGPRLKLVHLKDVQAAGGEVNVPLGTGAARIPEVMKELSRARFTGLVAFEYEKEGEIREDVRRQMAYARKFL